MPEVEKELTRRYRLELRLTLDFFEKGNLVLGEIEDGVVALGFGVHEFTGQTILLGEGGIAEPRHPIAAPAG